MQTCIKCQQQNMDTARICENCGADLVEFSNHAVALRSYRDNPFVDTVRISVYHDACPVCQQARGSYPVDQVPQLPMMGCSNPNGCRCVYEPWFTETHP